jgi:hypothetical protein
MGVKLDPKNARIHALAFAVIGFVFGALAGYHAISGELTGHTVDLKPAYRGFKTVPVEREDQPKEFRRANNFLWGIGALGFGVGALGVYFYRGLDD